MRSMLLYFRRTARVATLTIAFAFSFALSRFRSRSAGPRILRRYLERAGAAFVKLGQILAMRYDLLPPIYCQELSALLDQVSPSDTRQVIASIESELGSPISVLFASFDPKPLSSASVAQVHAAVLPSGERVVVKVKHPGVDARYRIDLRNLRLLAGAVSYTGVLRKIDIAAVLDEFERLALEELDFLHESRNIHVLHRLLDNDDIDHYGPQVYLPLCSRSVITMERLDGVWVRELLAAVQEDDTVRLEAWRRRGVTPERTSHLLLRSILEQCFTHRIFHADPHAGNLVVMAGGTLGYVDFGMVGWLDEKLWAEQFALNEALAKGNIHQAYESLLDTLEPLPDIDLSHFEMQVKTLLMEWLFATRVPGTPIQDRSSANLFLNLFDMVRREGLQMRLGSLRLCRALMISDIISLRLYPDLDRMSHLRQYYSERTQSEFADAVREELSTSTFFSAVLALRNSVQALPAGAQWLLKRLPEYGRRYEAALSSGERAFILLLKYGRIFVLLVFAATAGGQLVAEPFLPASSWAQATAALGDYWWVLAAASLLTWILIGRILQECQ